MLDGGTAARSPGERRFGWAVAGALALHGGLALAAAAAWRAEGARATVARLEEPIVIEAAEVVRAPQAVAPAGRTTSIVAPLPVAAAATKPRAPTVARTSVTPPADPVAATKVLAATAERRIAAGPPVAAPSVGGAGPVAGAAPAGAGRDGSGSGLGDGNGGSAGGATIAAAADRSRLLDAIAARIRAHRRYPELARRRGVEGRVGLSFSIRADGSVAQLTVRHPADPALDEAALEAVRAAAPLPPVDGALAIDLDFRLRDVAAADVAGDEAAPEEIP